MSTVVLVEQRPPCILMLASRVPTYTHIVISFLAVLLIQAFPSWATAKPPVREVTRKRRSSSLTSNASTLVDPAEADATKKDMNHKEKEKRHHISFSNKNPFNRLGSSVKMLLSRSKSMKPKLARRLSLPARRFSSHIVTALHNLTPHHCHPQDDADSYFPKEMVTVGDATTTDNAMVESDTPAVESKPFLVPFTQAANVEMVTAEPEGDIKQRESRVHSQSPKTKKTFRHVARRASVIFKDIIHRS
ncbi:hypothetical protein C0995_000542 [Termitomyces sp. Mi166|nr:hypothetical protein C0995_000542 [Termitomyces sp. Mi166\